MKLSVRTYCLLFVLIGLLYFSPIIFSRLTIWPSEFDRYVPDLHIILKSWSHFEVPLWTDLQFGGFPHHMVIHNPTYYPPIILLGLLQFNAFIGAKILLISHFILAMISMFFLARKYVNENYSFLAGLLFGFNPVMLHFVNDGWLTFVLGFAWMPFFLLFWLHENVWWKKVVFSGVILAFMLHSGATIVLYNFLVFIFFVEFFEFVRFRNFKRVLAFLAVLLLFFSLTFFKILPGMAFVKETPRVIPLSLDAFRDSSVSLFQLPSESVGYVLLFAILPLFLFIRRKEWFSFNLTVILFIVFSLGGFLGLVYDFIPGFKMQSASLNRLLYPVVPFLILLPLEFISKYPVLSTRVRKFILISFILVALLNFSFLRLGDYDGEIEQNQALQFISADKTCCWRAWQFEESGVDTTLNAYTTPLNIRTLFGVIGSRFYNSSYIHQLGVDHENISFFLTKYDIKYLLSNELLGPNQIPNNYRLLTKFPKSPAVKQHMSGQYVYVREEN